jgi:hypothetical protein
MNGTTMTNPVYVTPDQVADTNWKIVGTADFNGDGNPDLLWQHQTQGLLGVWLMDGTTMTNTVWVTPDQVADTNWKIVGPK